jgi:hypothetical protein
MPASNLTYQEVMCIVGTGDADYYVIVPPFGQNSALWYAACLNTSTFLGSYASQTAAEAAVQANFTAAAT